MARMARMASLSPRVAPGVQVLHSTPFVILERGRLKSATPQRFCGSVAPRLRGSFEFWAEARRPVDCGGPERLVARLSPVFPPSFPVFLFFGCLAL